jgi:hypothetical protein
LHQFFCCDGGLILGKGGYGDNRKKVKAQYREFHKTIQYSQINFSIPGSWDS